MNSQRLLLLSFSQPTPAYGTNIKTPESGRSCDLTSSFVDQKIEAQRGIVVFPELELCFELETPGWSFLFRFSLPTPLPQHLRLTKQLRRQSPSKSNSICCTDSALSYNREYWTNLPLSHGCLKTYHVVLFRCSLRGSAVNKPD